MDVSQTLSDFRLVPSDASATAGRSPGSFAGAASASGLNVLEAACSRAEADARAGRGDRAMDQFRALGADPRCPTSLLPRVAAGLAGLGDDASALEACREAARREPGRPEALFSAAFAMNRLGYPAELAIPIADRAVSLAPDFLPARALLAALLLEAGREVDAEDLLRDAPTCSTPMGGACRIGRMIARFLAPARA